MSERNLNESGNDSPRLRATQCLYDLRETVMEHFPAYWPAVEACLATVATLCLKDLGGCTALILKGGASSGKTTVASMFDGAEGVVRKDEFSSASFVSQAMTKRKASLAKDDLLPQVRYRVLLSPELAPTFRGKTEELEGRFAMLTSVLDGRGLERHGAGHGARGYSGDYVFSWIGCTTPFRERVWAVMAQLGSRLFFFDLPSTEQVSLEDLVRQSEGNYTEKLSLCRGVVAGYLEQLWSAFGGLPTVDSKDQYPKETGAARSVVWGQDPPNVLNEIARLAIVLAKLRGAYGRSDDTPGMPETPQRGMAVLKTLARGRALLHGRTSLSEEDLPMIRKVTQDSVPFAPVIRAAVKGWLSIRDVVALTGVSDKTALDNIMRGLAATKCFELDQEDYNRWNLTVTDKDVCQVFQD